MRKGILITAVMSLCLCTALSACGKKEENTETAGAGVVELGAEAGITGAETATGSAPEEVPATEELAIGGDITSEAEAQTDPQAQADAYISDYLEKEQTLSFANLTGKDLKELHVSFSEGALQDAELLQGNILRDGAGVNYRIEELSELRNAEHLKLTVTALATDDTRMEFTAIAIWDISATSIVLKEEDGAYIMYLE